MDKIDIWYKDYIEGIDLSKIYWIKLNSKQLEVFFKMNYFDYDKYDMVATPSKDPYFALPLGLHYLPYDHDDKENSYLIGLVDNKIGKKTIVAAMMYVEKYYLLGGQEEPLTYICTIETNTYLWNRGINNRLLEQVINYIDPSQHILISHESELGERSNITLRLKTILEKQGFNNKIWVDDYSSGILLDIGQTLRKKK